MKEGDVVLTPVPQADGQIKNRPALFLRTMPPFNDALVCGISTQSNSKSPVLMKWFAARMRISRTAGWRPTL